MPTFLTDPAPAFYLILLAFALVTGAIAARNQDRTSCIRFGIALAILLLVFAIDKGIESPREEAVRRVNDMVKAANERNADAFVSHVADSFDYKGKKIPREELRTAQFWSDLRNNDVRIAVWDFSRDDLKEIDAGTMEIGFLAKADAGGKSLPMYLRATFTKQPDGQMKLVKFASFDPVKRANEELVIPVAPFSR